MKHKKRLLGLFHAFIALGAIVGGLAAIIHPQAPLGMRVEELQDFPFPDFFIPGLILFGVIGLGNLAGAVVVARQGAWADQVSGGLGAALMVFIAVQCFMLGAIVFLHVLYFAFGTFLALRALLSVWRQKSFPFHWWRPSNS